MKRLFTYGVAHVWILISSLIVRTSLKNVMVWFTEVRTVYTILRSATANMKPKRPARRLLIVGELWCVKV